MELCKIRFDGYHYLIQPYKNVSSFGTEEIIQKTKKELKLGPFLEKKNLFVNVWAKENFPFENKGRKPKNKYYEKLDNALKKNYYIFMDQNGKPETLKEYLFAVITNDYDFYMKYHLENHDNIEKITKYIDSFCRRMKENLKARKNTFKRKALNNEWNYFVTFTYDNKKHTEETFVKTLKKKLQNLHTNWNWLYMGCFERSGNGRLHFHGLLYVPNGAMRGSIREEKYYDTTSHKRAISYINEEFEEKIGRNDFKPITKNDLTFTHALDYIVKYVGKSDNKIVYSRGIKDDIMALVDYEENVICKVSEYSPYYVLGECDKIVELTKDLYYAKVLTFEK